MESQIFTVTIQRRPGTSALFYVDMHVHLSSRQISLSYK